MNQKLLLVNLVLPVAFVSIVPAAPTTTVSPLPTDSSTISQEQLQELPQSDASQDKLFTFLPKLVTDRGTESAYTIGAGNFAAGLSLGYSYRDRTLSATHSDQLNQAFSLGRWNLKYGILDNLDAIVEGPSYAVKTSTYKSPYGTDFGRDNGFTDFWLGFKYNVVGNGGGPLAWAVSGGVKFPTASDHLETRDNYSGGLRSDFAYNLCCGSQLRIDDGFQVSENDRGCWNACFCNDLFVYSREYAHVSAFTGIESTVSINGRQDPDIRIKFGLVYQPKPNLQFFVDSGFGVEGAAPDYLPEIGLDWRFGNFKLPFVSK